MRPVGVVLAGGGSRRMGRDKASLEIGGKSLAAAAVERLARICEPVVVADRGRGVVAGVPSLADGPGRGPAAGLLGVAAVWPARPLLALACDLPGVPEGLLAGLAGRARAGLWDWVVPRGAGGLEPLCALYGPRALEVLAARVASGRFALHPLARERSLAVWVLGFERCSPWGPPADLFANLNRPEDLEALAQAGGSSSSRGSISRRKS